MFSKMLVSWSMMFLLSLLITAATTSPEDVKSGCQEKCGDVSVPYPFGIGKPDCALDDFFFLNCTNKGELRLFNTSVRSISVLNGTITVSINTAYDCSSNSSNNVSFFDQDVSFGSSGIFTFSQSRNVFTTIGCQKVAWFSNAEGTFGNACVSFCPEGTITTEEITCPGSGCCQASIPSGLKTLGYYLSRLIVKNFTEHGACGHAFLVDKSSFNAKDWPLSRTPNGNDTTDVVIEWVVRNETCEQVKRNGSAYACGRYAHCIDSENGEGYRCKCDVGFEGNPYLPDGCKDIDECKYQQRFQCKEGRCSNTIGNYTCHCPFGKYGDGRSGCHGYGITTLAAIFGASISLLIICLLLYIIIVKKRKDKNFRENGGMVLKQQQVRIFSELELVKATNNYDACQKLGEGGFGSVYKGVLTDNTQVAIKRINEPNKSKINEEFQHEIRIVLQVNHKNVVKLLGLCLQTKVPLLVYEFISNGALSDHIHEKKTEMLKNWRSRLRIAAETALALEYLHSLANPPIIHGDIKSANILLDENYTAKVADFGNSVVISPCDQNVVATTAQGTTGYLDPEYLMTGDLTVKSDVYSFGIVLLELLTGEKPWSTARFGECGTIIQYVIFSLENNSLLDILDFDVAEGEMKEIQFVAELAKRCVSSSAVNRPSMKEVSDELAGLKKFHDEFWAQQNSNETECLLDE